MVQSNITNLNHASELEIVVVMVETSVPAMETGEIDWEIMKTLGEHRTVAPQTTLSLNITSPKIYHFIVMHFLTPTRTNPSWKFAFSTTTATTKWARPCS